MSLECTRKLYYDKEVVDWARRGVVARVLNGKHVDLVQHKIKDAGFGNVRIILMGGDNVFFTCARKKDTKSIINEVAEFFNIFFSNVRF